MVFNILKTTLISLLITFSITHAQTNSTAINDIRTKYNNIKSNISTSSLTTINISDESTEGGEGKAYFENTELKLIEVVWYGETGKRVLEYYFDNDSLFFAFNQLYSYNAPIHLDKLKTKSAGLNDYFDSSKTTVKEDRYYFKNELLILWLNSENIEMNLDENSSMIAAKELVSHSKIMKNTFKKK